MHVDIVYVCLPVTYDDNMTLFVVDYGTTVTDDSTPSTTMVHVELLSTSTWVGDRVMIILSVVLVDVYISNFSYIYAPILVILRTPSCTCTNPNYVIFTLSYLYPYMLFIYVYS